MQEVVWYTEAIKTCLHTLHTDADLGLTSEEAEKRAKMYGINSIVREQTLQPLRIIARQFMSPMIAILAVAAGISFWLSHQVDGWVIVAAILANSTIGFFQEFKAERSLEALKKVVTFTATVIRDGKHMLLPVEQVTVGDIIELVAGVKVSADIRLIKSDALMINEAPLTGESMPVKKITEPLKTAVIIQEQANMAFFGTLVVSGKGLGVVTAIGMQTEIGKIASMLAAVKQEQTPLQKKLQSFAKTLSIIIVGIAVLIFIVGIALGQDLVTMFTTAVALAVAAVPEGIVVVLTMILAIGMQRILQQKALVRKLVAAEVLGSTNVICTDKTGTLTAGEMHVVKVLTSTHEAAVKTKPDAETDHPEEVFTLMQHALLCSDGFLENPIDPFEEWRVFGNPTDRAVVKASAYLGITRQTLEKEKPRTGLLAFSSERKYMLTVHEVKGRTLVIFKGAPEIALSHATHIDIRGQSHPLKKDTYDKLVKDSHRFSREGLRIVAVGYKWLQEKPEDLAVHTIINDMVFEGFLCLQDPLRPEAAEMVRLTAQAGMRTVMLTGDHRLTAQAIAKALGLPSAQENILDGEVLERLNSKELHDAISRVSVFARVSPRDKLRIIDAFQKRGAVVAMTGDGVNDAPALKAADIGVALGSGTDVAKESAQIILLENNFSVIVRAIEEGRVIFANIKKVILYLISDSFTEIVLIAVSLFLGMPLPLLASQILWINLVSDVLPALALSVEPKESDVMSEKPVPRGEPIVSKQMRKAVFAVSLTTGFAALLLFYAYWRITGDVERARAITFFAVSIDSLLYVFSVRALHKPIWKHKAFSNMWLNIAVAGGLGLQLLAFYTPFFQRILHTQPLHAEDLLIILFFAVIGTTILEMVKGSFSKNKPVSKI